MIIILYICINQIYLVMKCLFLGFLPAGSEWIIIALIIFIPFFVLFFRLVNAIIRYLNHK